jgi:formylglycine-generating enzyme required for sulfatase activity
MFGQLGADTRAAITAFQRDAGLAPNGYATDATRAALEQHIAQQAREAEAAARRQAQARADAERRVRERAAAEEAAREQVAEAARRVQAEVEAWRAAAQRPRLLPKTRPFEPDMIALPGGTFWMGSPEDEPGRDNDEGPRHRVTIQPFAIGRTEVTFAAYDRFAEATGRAKPDDEGWGRGQRPVVNVSWYDAVAYAAWLSGQTGANYRLPTEAEWEYVARAGTTTRFWTGHCIHTDQANYNAAIRTPNYNAAIRTPVGDIVGDFYDYDLDDCGAWTGVYRGKTVPVGSLPANLWGLHEVAGNVWEWTADCWHRNYAGAPSDGSLWDESGDGDCAHRLVRGGGWYDYPEYLRSANRYRYLVDDTSLNVGFRLARTL